MKTEPSFNELQRVIVTNKIELNELTLAMIDKMLSESRMNSARIIKLLQQFQSSTSNKPSSSQSHTYMEPVFNSVR